MHRLVSTVATAMQQHRIGFAVQQINDVEDPSSVLYSECFGRLIEANGSIRTAGEFMSVIEAAGIAPRFDRHMTELAFEWLACHPFDILGCNISAQNLSDPDSWKCLYNLLAKHHHLAGRLVLELTESMPITTLAMAAEHTQILRGLGYSIAMDDFGTGFSTAEALLSIPVDIVKIDAFFVRDNRRFGDSNRLLTHMVGMASCVAPTVVVQGVETYSQFEAAKTAGATHVQGYLFSEPSLAPKYRRSFRRQTRIRAPAPLM